MMAWRGNGDDKTSNEKHTTTGNKMRGRLFGFCCRLLGFAILACCGTVVAATDSALTFNGNTAYVDTGTSVIPTSGDFTVECWAFCPTAPSANKAILSQGGTGNAFYFGTDASNDLRLGAAWGTISPAIPFPLGGWHHFAVVKSSANTIFYLDGTNRLSRGTAMSNPASTTGLRLAAQWSGGEYWPGSVADVRIWNVARNAAQIQTNRFAVLTGAETGLVACWQFTEGQGTNCTSIGSSSVSGMLVGGPRWTTSGVWTPNWILNGANPVTNLYYSIFSDPGATVSIPKISVVAGYESGLVLSAAGSVVEWGDNSQNETNVPAAATNVVGLASGLDFSLALKSDGTAVGWGADFFGQADVPAAGTNLTAVAAGFYFSLGLKADGTVLGWGSTLYGQTTPPASVTNTVAIAAGWYHSLALNSNGNVVAWGNNNAGQTNVPAAATNVVAIAASENYSMALKADGTVVAWGENTYGQTNLPAAATNVIALAAGWYHALALKSDGTVVGWGRNLNNAATIPANVTNVVAIAAGNSFNLAQLANGTVVGWGDNIYGQTNIPASLFFLGPPAVSGSVATNTPGTYTLTYSFTNSLGAVTATNRTVVVTPLPVVLTGSRTYDGTTNATAAILSVSNAVAGDNVTVSSGTGGLANSGIGNQLITSAGTLVLGGTKAANYTLAGLGGAVNISAKSVTLTGVTSAGKNYDGTTTAVLSGGTISGSVAGDTVSFTAGSGNFSSKYLGTWPVTASGFALTSSGVATNYTLSAQPTVASATIAAKPVTITGVAVANKTYDGTSTAILSGGAVAGFVAGDSVTFTAGNGVFGSKYIGTWPVTASGFALAASGLATNYSLSAQPVVANAVISPAGVTIASGLTANNKIYDGTVTATISSNNVVLNGIVALDSASVFLATNGYSATFGTAAAGINKPVTLANLALTGVVATNYSLTQPALTANISQATPKLVLVSGENASGYKDNVAFTARIQTNGVTAADATGGVQFRTNTFALGSAINLTAGVAGTNLANLPRATNTITAEYAGDGNYFGSTNTLLQVVTNHPPVLGILSVTHTAGLNLHIFLAAVVTNWTDVDGDTVALQGINLVTANGVNLLTNSTQILYPSGATQNDVITYSVTDGQGGTNSGIINVVVNPFATGQQTASPLLVSNNMITTTFYGFPGLTYAVQRSTNLLDWVGIVTNTVGNNARINVADSFPDLGGQIPASAYYRLRWNP